MEGKPDSPTEVLMRLAPKRARAEQPHRRSYRYVDPLNGRVFLIRQFGFFKKRSTQAGRALGVRFLVDELELGAVEGCESRSVPVVCPSLLAAAKVICGCLSSGESPASAMIADDRNGALE